MPSLFPHTMFDRLRMSSCSHGGGKSWRSRPLRLDDRSHAEGFFEQQWPRELPFLHLIGSLTGLRQLRQVRHAGSCKMSCGFLPVRRDGRAPSGS